MLAMDAVETITDEDDEAESSVNLYARVQQETVEEKRHLLQMALSPEFGMISDIIPPPFITQHVRAWAAAPVG